MYNNDNVIIINDANSINNTCHTMELEILEEENYYDRTQIGEITYRKLSRSNKKKDKCSTQNRW